MTYASAHELAGRPPRHVLRPEDTAEGSAWFTYWDAEFKTHRQVYFENELSAAAKYDYAIASGLAGIGIWTLDNDRGYSAMYDVLRTKFYNPSHGATVTSVAGSVSLAAGTVRLRHVERVRNTGNVPERGTLDLADLRPGWSPDQEGLDGADGLPRQDQDRPGSRRSSAVRPCRAGTYRLKVQFVSKAGIWKSPVDRFRQPY